MGKYDLMCFETPQALAEAAAEAWLAKIAAAQQGLPYCAALSGGRIARHFFGAVAEKAKSRTLSWGGIHFFWADERCVPPGDAESNFALADEWLFRPLNIPADQIHRIAGELPPAEAAGKAVLDLRRAVSAFADGQPILDIIFLGMGEDGHVASLFPDGTKETSVPTETYRAVVARKPPPRRITLTYPAISAAREVWVLASGTGKAEALRSSLRVGGQTPLGRVLAMRPHTTIFTDIQTEPQKP